MQHTENYQQKYIYFICYNPILCHNLIYFTSLMRDNLRYKKNIRGQN